MEKNSCMQSHYVQKINTNWRERKPYLQKKKKKIYMVKKNTQLQFYGLKHKKKKAHTLRLTISSF